MPFFNNPHEMHILVEGTKNQDIGFTHLIYQDSAATLKHISKVHLHRDFTYDLRASDSRDLLRRMSRNVSHVVPATN